MKEYLNIIYLGIIVNILSDIIINYQKWMPTVKNDFKAIKNWIKSNISFK